MLEQVSQKMIGYRVKAAREAKALPQDALLSVIGLNDRQSISDIETGKRALKPDELVALSDFLDRDVEYFIDPFAVTGEAQFSWRAPPELSQECLDDFEAKAGKWIGLLRWLRECDQGRANPLKMSLRLTAQSSYEDAIERAEALVDRLDLGVCPADRLIEKIETGLDIPVLFVDAIKGPNGESISGATCHLQDLGVILVNRNESETRRYFDIAHELFHALTWDAMKPDHRESNAVEDRGRGNGPRIEQLANNFAAGLLMPQKALDQLIDTRHIQEVTHLIDVAARLKVAPPALAWRLFNLKRIRETTKNMLVQAQAWVQNSATPKRFSNLFVKLLHKAIDSGQLSVRKAAKAMGMSMTQFAELFTEHSLERPFAL